MMNNHFIARILNIEEIIILLIAIESYMTNDFKNLLMYSYLFFLIVIDNINQEKINRLRLKKLSHKLDDIEVFLRKYINLYKKKELKIEDIDITEKLKKINDKFNITEKIKETSEKLKDKINKKSIIKIYFKLKKEILSYVEEYQYLKKPYITSFFKEIAFITYIFLASSIGVFLYLLMHYKFLYAKILLGVIIFVIIKTIISIILNDYFYHKIKKELTKSFESIEKQAKELCL